VEVEAMGGVGSILDEEDDEEDDDGVEVKREVGVAVAAEVLLGLNCAGFGWFRLVG
jgi:hypothetical protein